ncbi:MAG: hypothetical protein P3W84_000380, partial [Thermodesulfobacteriaceae bacterium]|nr:hypothetical protein [Thermodesulfobacteriaceae bacterium]
FIVGFFLINFPLFAQEKVEVLTPEKFEVKEEISYPIPNIPVLKELSYQPSESAILKTRGTINGMLVFKGNYKIPSLVEFYRIQMRANGWEEVGSFTSKTTFLAFKRPEGQAFISLSEGWVQTTIRIIFFVTGVK